MACGRVRCAGRSQGRATTGDLWAMLIATFTRSVALRREGRPWRPSRVTQTACGVAGLLDPYHGNLRHRVLAIYAADYLARGHVRGEGE
jgi:hypothetical protein